VPADAARIGDGDDCIRIGSHVRLDPASGGASGGCPAAVDPRPCRFATLLQWLLDQVVRERAAEGQSRFGAARPAHVRPKFTCASGPEL